MALNRTSTRMIQNPFDDTTTLHTHVVANYQLSAYDFGYHDTDSVSDLLGNVLLGINYIKTRGYGMLAVPPKSGYSDYSSFIEVIHPTASTVDITYRGSNYRYPINSETRPFGGDFQIGDTVQNTDITNTANRAQGWICTEAGTPGVWKPYGHIQNHFSEVETMSYLPDANVSQHGRMISVPSVGNSEILYMCRKVGTKYEWINISREYGPTPSRPTDNLIVGLQYFNTDINQMEYWNGTGWTHPQGTVASMTAQADSVTTSSTELRNQFNELLEKLRVAGLMSR